MASHGFPSFELVGKHYWITGGCGGIGLSMARAFLSHGKTVTLFDKDISAGRELVDAGEPVHLFEMDISDPKGVEAALEKILQDTPAPDVLVNNVGISPKYDADGNRLRTWTIDVDRWNQIFAINVTAYHVFAKAVVPGMITTGHGRIINIASYAARTGGYQPAPHYVASKAAVLGLTKGMAKDLGREGILVNAINPGRIQTDMTKDVSDEVNAAIIPSIPCGRLGLPDDIAKAAVFLSSSYADYMTGTAMEVNGGLYMGP